MAAVRARRRRHRLRWLPWSALVLAAAAAVVAERHVHVAGRPAVVAHPRPHLRPPAPIPGYLLIADRGNNRMLLVDGAKHILWRYPRRGLTPVMPFRYDDDTFFGPRADRIISNQEDQHTVQLVSFPGGRVLWRYGHVNQKGSAPGFLNT